MSLVPFTDITPVMCYTAPVQNTVNPVIQRYLPQPGNSNLFRPTDIPTKKRQVEVQRWCMG
jgi:hypothetical protein